MADKDTKDTYDDDDLIDRSVFDHIIKKVEAKNAKRSSQSGGSKIFPVFIIGMIIFVGLLASGNLTGDGPFINNRDNNNNGNTNTNTNGENPIAFDDLCVDHGGIAAHYHYTVSIYIDSQMQTIPANIGISSSCMKAIHTHDATGKVHVEYPSSFSGYSPDIGKFFDIWGKTFTSTQLLDHTGTVTMEVNGDSNSQLQDYVPSNGDDIVIYLTSS